MEAPVQEEEEEKEEEEKKEENKNEEPPQVRPLQADEVSTALNAMSVVELLTEFQRMGIELSEQQKVDLETNRRQVRLDGADGMQVDRLDGGNG